MPDFGELFDKAKKYANEHPDQVGKGIDKLEDLVDKQTGGKYSDQIESAGQSAERYLAGHPGPQDEGQQGQGQQEQGQQGHGQQDGQGPANE